MIRQSCPLITSSTLGTSLGDPFQGSVSESGIGSSDDRRTLDILPFFRSFFLDACFEKPQSDEIYVRILVLERLVDGLDGE